VCSFEGFQFGIRRVVLALELEDPDRKVAQPLRGIGDLHHSVHFLSSFLFSKVVSLFYLSKTSLSRQSSATCSSFQLTGHAANVFFDWNYNRWPPILISTSLAKHMAGQ